MKILCTFGLHAWEGCRCTRCDKRRDTGHGWEGCRCAKCAKVRDSEHAWEACKCSRCARTRDEAHVWEGCKCRVCAKTRNTEHQFEGCRCVRCGANGTGSHTWRDLVCASCGKGRFADDAVTFQNMPMIKNVAIKEAAFEAYKTEKGLNSFSGPAYVAARILGLSDQRAKALSANSSAYQLETGPASRFNSTGHWGSAPVVKVAILVRYL